MHAVRSRSARRASAAATVLATSALLISPTGSATASSQAVLTSQPGSYSPAAVQPAASSYDGIPSDVELVRTRTSLLGTHRWYRQVRDGHYVVGGWFARHIDSRTGQITDWDGRKQFASVQPASATLSPGNAKATAARAVGVPPDSARTAPLMILPSGTRSAARLVWPVSTATGAGAQTAYVDAATGRILKTIVTSKKFRGLVAKVTGHGRVFDPNPVVKLQDELLTDHADAATAVPRTAYSALSLRRLDGSHTLTGRWVRIVNRYLASSSTDRYVYTRANDKFEQVNAYHAVDAEQHYLQVLGFVDANAEAQKVKVNAFTDDNSYFDPSTDKISLGTGGVDDAEDPEVIWHEYGHAIQADQVLDWGWTAQAQAIGEGFGDYMAVAMSQATAAGYDGDAGRLRHGLGRHLLHLPSPALSAPDGPEPQLSRRPHRRRACGRSDLVACALGHEPKPGSRPRHENHHRGAVLDEPEDLDAKGRDDHRLDRAGVGRRRGGGRDSPGVRRPGHSLA